MIDKVRVWNESQMAELADKLTDSLPNDPDGPPIPDRLVQISLKNLGMKPIVQSDSSEELSIDPFDESVSLAADLARKLRSAGFIVRSASISHDRSVSIDVTP